MERAEIAIDMELAIDDNDIRSTNSIITPHGGELFDDDGRPQRTGTVWTASAHIITAIIGSGVLSLAWAMAQLGWIAGPIILISFSLITFYMSNLLVNCYRTGDPITGKRNHRYMDVVKSNLGKNQVWLCVICQYLNLFGTMVGYTITASISAAEIQKNNCFHNKGHEANCEVSNSLYMIIFGIFQICMSQLPNFHNLWFLSILASIMSFSYSSISIGLSIAKIISGDTGKTTLTGTEIGVDVNSAQKIWLALQSLGNIAFAYSYSMILIEIQDTLKTSPGGNNVMKKASFIGVSTTTTFYLLNALLGYAAFGNRAPGNILTGFSEPYWLVDFANICVVIHLIGAYQVYCQPIYAAVESTVAKAFPNGNLITSSHTLKLHEKFQIKISIFPLIWRTIFVMITTFLAILMPFFNAILGFLGSVVFWPLTIYFPVRMYIKSKQIPFLSPKWIVLQSLSVLCFIISLSSACASVQGIVQSLKTYTPFKAKL